LTLYVLQKTRLVERIMGANKINNLSLKRHLGNIVCWGHIILISQVITNYIKSSIGSKHEKVKSYLSSNSEWNQFVEHELKEYLLKFEGMRTRSKTDLPLPKIEIPRKNSNPDNDDLYFLFNNRDIESDSKTNNKSPNQNKAKETPTTNYQLSKTPNKNLKLDPCEKCGNFVLPNSTYLIAMNKVWHSYCLICYDCGNTLTTDRPFSSFKINGMDKFICKFCIVHRKICFSCNNVIGDSQFVSFENQTYHSNCVKCVRCKSVITNKICKTKNGFQCATCTNEKNVSEPNFSQQCMKCSSPVSSKYCKNCGLFSGVK